jgi:hypothetical protein
VGDQALAKPLLTKLAAAAAAQDANARAGLIKAYIQQVNAARGKTLTPGEADLLILRAGQL